MLDQGVSMKKVVTLSVVVVGLLMAAAPLFAHHGRGAAFDMQNQRTLKGTVSQISWRNPHVVIYMDVKGDDGKVVTWSFENSGTTNLALAGYDKNTLKVGQEITAVANPARNGTPVGIIIKFVTADGKELMSRVPGGGNPLD
jgi:hypothetical protein